MFRVKDISLYLLLVCQITLGALVFRDSNDIIEDINEIAKQIERKFTYVRYVEDAVVYLNENVTLVSAFNNPEPPTHWDWRESENVSPVKNQGQCTACWAFSTVACIESHLSIYNKQKIVLSEQFLIDCIQNGKDNAPKCGHYTLIKAFSDIVYEYGGVLKTTDYRPYSAQPGTCTYVTPPPTPVAVAGFIRVPSNEDVMVKYLYKHGPLTAAINSASMAKYGQNNYIDEPTDDACSPSPNKLDHAVLIVGYSEFVGKNRKVPYWIIKNSWGEKWGDRGFYYLVRGRNACGIANDVSFAVLP